MRVGGGRCCRLFTTKTSLFPATPLLLPEKSGPRVVRYVWVNILKKLGGRISCKISRREYLGLPLSHFDSRKIILILVVDCTHPPFVLLLKLSWGSVQCVRYVGRAFKSVHTVCPTAGLGGNGACDGHDLITQRSVHYRRSLRGTKMRQGDLFRD